MKKMGNTMFLAFLGSLLLNPHKLDTLAKTINSNSQPTTTSQTVDTRRFKSSSRFSLPTIPLTKTTSTLLLRTFLLWLIPPLKRLTTPILRKMGMISLLMYRQPLRWEERHTLKTSPSSSQKKTRATMSQN